MTHHHNYTKHGWRNHRQLALIAVATLASPINSYAQGDAGGVDIINMFNDKDDIDLVLQYYEPKTENGVNVPGGLGVHHAININLAQRSKTIAAGDPLNTYSIKLHSVGDHALDPARNAKDYTQSSLDLGWEYANTIDMKLPDVCQAGNIDFNDPDASIPAVCLEPFNGNLYYFTVALTAAQERSQQDSDKAYNYGLKAGFVFRPSSDSNWSTLNIFDLPFRMIREATLGDSAPDRYSFPSFNVALEQVDPKDNADRLLVDPALEEYDRLYWEIAFSSKVTEYNNQTVRFSASWRKWEEQDPSAAIEAANLDEFEYKAYTFSVDGGWSISYSKGRLPFDALEQKVWDIGYQVSF